MAEKLPLEQLEDASWRGIKFPYIGTRDFGFSQETAAHRFIFRDQQLIESLGRNNPTFRFQIPFRETIQQYGWKALFSDVYPKFLAACMDRSAGFLVDSVHGQVRAKCVSFSEALDVERRDGVDVSVEFIYSPEPEDADLESGFTAIARTISGLQSTSVEFGSAVAELSDAQKKEIAESYAEAKQGEVDLFNAVRAGAGSVQRAKNKIKANLVGLSYKMEQTKADIEEAEDPELEGLRRDSARLSRSSSDLARTVTDPTRPWRIVQTTIEIGRIAFCTSAQMTVNEFIEFNADLADALLIPVGTRVKVPRRDV